jgi:hypothetical protein
MKMLSQTGEHSSGGIGVTGHGKGINTHIGNSSSNSSSMVGLYRDILRNEGWRGLWAGNGANLLRVFPAKAIVFSSNDMYKSMLYKLTQSSKTSTSKYKSTPDTKALSGPLSFLAGGLAGMTASALTYPLDLARGRISGKLAKQGKKEYGGIIQTVLLTVKDEGVRALYKGVTPTILGAMPYEGIKFGTVGLLENIFPKKSKADEHPASVSPVLRKMLFGGLGGVMAGLITYPNDTVRRLLQLQGSRGTQHAFTGYWDCVAQTYRAHGMARFYRGLTINVIRMAPNTAVQFGSYELLKEWTATI